MSAPHSHQPGPLKKKNKPFKSRHASKSSLKRDNKGKVEAVVRTNPRVSTNIARSKADRRNQSKQIQRDKREEAMEQKRLTQGNQGAPKLIAVIALSAKVDVKSVVKMMLDEMEVSEAQQMQYWATRVTEPITMSVPKFKSRLAIYPANRNLTALLDIAKVADLVMFAMETTEVIDAYGVALLSALKAQGLPTVMGAIVGLEGIAMKHRSEAKKRATKIFHQRFTDEPRIVSIDAQSDVANLVRFLSVGHTRQFWRNNRSYMLPQGVQWKPNGEVEGFGTLELTGYIRGQNFDVHNLVHLTGLGDFQVSHIDSSNDPYAYDKRGISVYDVDMKLIHDDHSTHSIKPVAALATPNPEYQETLIAQNEVDDMNNEQTWPTEDDEKFAEKLKSRKKLRVPKGMNAYMARWIVDSDEEVEEGDEEGDEEGSVNEGEEDGMNMDGQEEEDEEEDEEEEEEEMEEIDDEETTLIKKLEADAEALKDEEDAAAAGGKPKKRVTFAKTTDNPDLEIDDEEIEDDFDYPDEVEIPPGELAQDAFRDYRGLRSFRTSPWDPKENLPRDYGKIFQFGRFDATRKRVFKAMELASNETVPVGTFVTIHLKDVHESVLAQHDPSCPLIVSSLFIFENKFSVMHYAISKSLNYEPYVKTGENLLFHVGFRRFSGSALFTEDTRGSTKYKMEKLLHPARGCIATVFAPVTFPHAPVLVWKIDEEGVPCLAASGTVRTCDPDRIIVKKIVLTGHPFSVDKGKVVVRGMFYHPSDVRYYQKAELFTKNGVRGQIKVPLGTKGLFKCIFGDRITNADTVCLSLYKRVFPNWLECQQPPRVPGTLTVAPVEDRQVDQDEEMNE